MNRRTLLRTAGLAAGMPLLNQVSVASESKNSVKFRFSLNTSTIRGQKPGVEKYIDIAARAGYDCIELWLPEVKEYLEAGGSLKTIRKLLDDHHLQMVNAIGFSPWMVNDEEERQKGFQQMKEEMEILATLNCPRIAAPAFGMFDSTHQLNMFDVGERLEKLIELGSHVGVTPQLEFWGSSPVFYHIGQALMASSVANNPAARILADVYHLHRGNSGFESLKMIDGKMIEIFHMNDYPGNIPREKLEDKDRVYPGDGVAPLRQVLTDLKNMQGTRILSLELFNPEYWKQDPLLVAKTGLAKMKKLVNEVG